MRRILLSCALLAVLAAPAVAAARGSGSGKPGYVVVRKATGDGGVNGSPVVTLIVRGFVLGRISQEGQVDVLQLRSVSGQGQPQATSGASSRAIRRGNHATGKEFTGSNFRFRAMGGLYSVTVRGSGVYLFAGGHGHVILRGSSRYKRADGWYSLNGSRFRSLPAKPMKLKLGRG